MTNSAHWEILGLLSLVLAIRALLVHVTQLSSGATWCQHGWCSSQPLSGSISEVMYFLLSWDNSVYICAGGKIDPMCQVPPSNSAVSPACCSPSLHLFPSRKLLLYLQGGEKILHVLKKSWVSEPRGLSDWARELICPQWYSRMMHRRMTLQNEKSYLEASERNSPGIWAPWMGV